MDIPDKKKLVLLKTLPIRFLTRLQLAADDGLFVDEVTGHFYVLSKRLAHS